MYEDWSIFLFGESVLIMGIFNTISLGSLIPHRGRIRDACRYSTDRGYVRAAALARACTWAQACIS